MKTVLAAAAVAALVAAAPAWHVDQRYPGPRIDRRWEQVNSGNSFCVRPGTKALTGRVLTLSADGTYGDCERLVSAFTTRYGLTAARVWISRRVLRDRAAWPAFWAYPVAVPWPSGGEIDVWEQLGRRRECATYHYGTPARPRTTGAHCVPLTAGWHTFAVRWYPGVLRFSYDGRRVITYRGAFITGVPANWLVEIKSFPDVTPVPASIRVAWFRHWRRA